MCTHVLNFNSFKSSQLCKLYLINIVTRMCCNYVTYVLWHISRPWGRGIYWHILKVHNLGGGGGGTKFGKFSKFNTVGTNNWCPWNFRGFRMNWIYLSETLLGPTGHFSNGQKRQKRAEGFWFGVNFTHFCLSVVYVNLFLENHSIVSHEILYSCPWYKIGGQYIQTMAPVCWRPYWGYFGGLFWDMYLFFLIYVQYFVVKFCSGVLGINLIITNTVFFWNHVPIFRGSF